MNKITINLLSLEKVNLEILPHISHALTDSQFTQCKKIDMLIEIGTFWVGLYTD